MKSYNRNSIQCRTIMLPAYWKDFNEKSDFSNLIFQHKKVQQQKQSQVSQRKPTANVTI